eukprot:RCo046869
MYSPYASPALYETKCNERHPEANAQPLFRKTIMQCEKENVKRNTSSVTMTHDTLKENGNYQTEMRSKTAQFPSLLLCQVVNWIETNNIIPVGFAVICNGIQMLLQVHHLNGLLHAAQHTHHVISSKLELELARHRLRPLQSTLHIASIIQCLNSIQLMNKPDRVLRYTGDFQ